MTNDELEQLHTSLVAQRDRLTLTIDRLRAAIDKTPHKGTLTRRLIAYWCEHWKARYRENYVVVAGKDTVLLGKLLDRMPVEEVERRMLAFLQTDEPFYVKARHPLGMFQTSVNRYIPEAASGAFALAAPVDCRHTPPCKDDVQHTRRITKEARSA